MAWENSGNYQEPSQISSIFLHRDEMEAGVIVIVVVVVQVQYNTISIAENCCHANNIMYHYEYSKQFVSYFHW